MARLALVVGSSLRGAEPPGGDWEVLQRHGEQAAYLLPGAIDHAANMRALAERGCDRVLAVGSVGSLRREIAPGTLLCPEDFIALGVAHRTALSGPGAHRVPGFDREWRADVLGAFAAAAIAVRDRGVYWQTPGPRLETAAEVGVIAAHADVVGMTVASEAIAAGELGLRYAAICAVDNLANGIDREPLEPAQIDASRRAHRDELVAALAAVAPRLASGSGRAARG